MSFQVVRFTDKATGRKFETRPSSGWKCGTDNERCAYSRLVPCGGVPPVSCIRGRYPIYFAEVTE